MTSIAVTASICANASEAALLVACFMRVSLDLGMTHRGARRALTVRLFTRNTPRRVFALTSPHSANIDRAKVEQYCGGILTRLCRCWVNRRILSNGTGPFGKANKNLKNQGESWPASIIATRRNRTNA